MLTITQDTRRSAAAPRRSAETRPRASAALGHDVVVLTMGFAGCAV